VAEAQAIGVTKGGRNSKIHAVVDEECRPWVFVLTPGNTADCTVAETCASLIPGIAGLVADKGYDTEAFRAWLKQYPIKTVIPGRSNRKKRIRYDRQPYKGRNVVERCVVVPRNGVASPPATTSSHGTTSPPYAS